MLELCTLLLKQCELSVGGIEDSLLLCNIQSRHRATLVPLLDELQSFSLKGNGFLHDCNFGIEFAKLKIISSQF